MRGTVEESNHKNYEIEVEGVNGNFVGKDRAASTRLGSITADSEGNSNTLQHSQKIVDKIILKSQMTNTRLKAHTSTAVEEQELEY